MPRIKQIIPRSRKVVLRGIAIFALLILAALQFIPPSRTNPPVTNDMIAATAAPEAEARILKGACYDCHSHQTRWPWYASVAPISWWTARHVREGREHLNFSDWPQGKPWSANAKLESIAHALRDDSMPPSSYRLLHSKARLSDEERLRLATWAKTSAASLQMRQTP